MKRLFVLLFLIAMAQEPAPRVIEITAKRFEFTPNAITFKKDEAVTIRLVSTDRAHGLLIHALNVDLDATPDHPAEITITPHTAGRFDAICDHYCGMGHGNMKMTVTVE